MREMSGDMDIVFNNGDLYEVLVDNKEGHIVNLGAKDCECRVENF